MAKLIGIFLPEFLQKLRKPKIFRFFAHEVQKYSYEHVLNSFTQEPEIGVRVAKL
jgi:hypothetical protein